MKKRVIPVSILLILISILSILLLPTISAGSLDQEMQKLTYYAEQYETGNINYVQLLVYVSSVRESLNEILGATGKEIGGVVKQEKIKTILGEPNEETKWVWVEGEEHDKKLDNYVPVWKKIVFDGKKIQIRLEAFPSIFTKKQFNEGLEDKEEVGEEPVKEGDLIYRLHFGIEFKKPEEQLDIQGKINEIKSLAEVFNSEPSQTNAEALAKESVNAEKTFESYFRQNQGKCEDLMASIFGSENQWPSQNMIVNEISFYEGEKFEVIARLEMCDDCGWNWINLDLWVDMRGPMPKIEGEMEMISPDQFKNKDDSYYKTEIISLLNSYKKAAEEGNWGETNKIKQKIWVINEAWNQKANDVWKEIEKNDINIVVENTREEESNTIVENREDSNTNNIVENTITGNLITGNVIEENNNKQSEGNNDPYYWIKQEQEKRKKEKELRKKNYEERKQFYLGLFLEYDKKEYSFVQIEFKKRLIEEFKEFGEEICDNNQDDNKNEKIDCDDDQCGGKICGKGKNIVQEGNEIKEVEVDFYCIAGECKAKEEIVEIKEVVCGNHICEGNETTETCTEDCVLCPQYAPIECAGRVIFKGKDENNCSLEPTCIEEQTCSVNEDCRFLCGNGECVEGKCQVKELSECSEEECVDGTQRTMSCEYRESIISSICSNGLWIDTKLACLGISGEEVEEKVVVGEVVGNQCSTRSDCGRENDVCSNGRCVTIPEIIQPEIKEPEYEEEREEAEEIEQPEAGQPGTGEEQTPEQTQPTEQPSETPSEQETPTTGGIIFTFFRTLLSRAKITGAAITGFQTEETTPPSETGEEQTPPPEQQPQQTECADIERGCGGPCPPCEERREEEGREDDKKRDEEQKERCRKDCNRPCIEKCIRENCGEEMDCNVDEESKKCEETCKPDDSCVEKCMKGGDWWKEFEQKDEHKEEKGVFESGGNCRTSQGKTEGFIWFGGWGDPFEQIQSLKQKYYSSGNADWCKYDLQNLIKQREEFEKGFNQEFAKWFFEKYLSNSAEDWEQAVSGIFELYWNNVDNQREIANRMKCLGINNINEIMNYNLIEIKYDTEYGSLEYWEEVKEVEIPGLEGKFTIISPYMKIWIFPPIGFIKYEMKESMKNHEFPGSPEDSMERKNEEGATAEEKEMIKQDKKFMEKIKAISQQYGGNLDVVIQFKDDTTEEVLFNLYVQVNENDILKIKPMLPEENPSEDVKVEIPFSKIYDLIYMQEKEMRGAQTESPPWDKKIHPMQKIKEVVNGVKMYFKVIGIINSAKFTPAGSESEIKSLSKSFFYMMGKAEKSGEGMNEEEIEKMKKEAKEGDIWESKEKITGEVILG